MLEPALLALETAQDLFFPALPDALNRSRGETCRRLVVQPRAQKRVDVRMRGAVMAAVLMDREDALDPTGRSAERLVHGVSEDPLRQASTRAKRSAVRCRRSG
jgi:hypothetical protein